MGSYTWVVSRVIRVRRRYSLVIPEARVLPALLISTVEPPGCRHSRNGVSWRVLGGMAPRMLPNKPYSLKPAPWNLNAPPLTNPKPQTSDPCPPNPEDLQTLSHE